MGLWTNSGVLFNKCIWVIYFKVEVLWCCIWWWLPKFLKGWCVELFSSRFSKGSLDNFEWFPVKKAFDIINRGIGFCLKGKAIVRERYWNRCFNLAILSSQSWPLIRFIVIKMLVFLSGFKSLEVSLIKILHKENIVYKLVEIANWLCIWAIIVPGDEAKYCRIIERVVGREVIKWGSMVGRVCWFCAGTGGIRVVRIECGFPTFLDVKNTKTILSWWKIGCGYWFYIRSDSRFWRNRLRNNWWCGRWEIIAKSLWKADPSPRMTI